MQVTRQLNLSLAVNSPTFRIPGTVSVADICCLRDEVAVIATERKCLKGLS